ncbi:unnamed protein product [Lactuca virosa]|uniref:Uncharacterized protein n=1 Tax=Lactuca virosa TaxID=75947 RepID=A0AAU9PIC0_9ASTR|nr:unnamed protein product [Lactuca virosa]
MHRTRRVVLGLGESERKSSRFLRFWNFGEFRSSSQTVSDLAPQQPALRGEFPSSRNGSTATMPARLVSSSSGLRSDAVVQCA